MLEVFAPNCAIKATARFNAAKPSTTILTVGVTVRISRAVSLEVKSSNSVFAVVMEESDINAPSAASIVGFTE